MKASDTTTTNIPPTADEYSETVSTRSKPASVLSAPLRQAVLSAVYSDLSAKNNRSTNVVISGVAPESTRADKDIVVDLIARELHTQSTVRVVNVSASRRRVAFNYFASPCRRQSRSIKYSEVRSFSALRLNRTSGTKFSSVET